MGTMPAATAAADPPEEPPALRAGFHGLRQTGPMAGSVDKFSPNSGTVVLPKGTNPPALKRAISVLSWVSTGACCAKWRQLARPLPPASAAPRSFTKKGTPASVARGGSASKQSKATGSNQWLIAPVRVCSARARCIAMSSKARGVTSPSRTHCAMVQASALR